MIPMQFALRRRMMMAGGGGGAPISELPLGALINIGTDGGWGTPNYEIADKDNLVSGGVVLVRKNIYSRSVFKYNNLNVSYPDSTLDNLIKTTIYDQIPQKLRDKMMDVSFALYSISLSASENITRKIFALTHTMAGFGDNHGVAEGVALQLYTSNASRLKYGENDYKQWWLSSQDFYENDDFHVNMEFAVSDKGTSLSSTPRNEYGVVHAFVIPSKTPYDPTPNPDGSYNLIL